ncbi:MAG: winged helix-turn-helix transcriptional regulator [Chitinophagaceae bacterium]|nr:winged helix-turn-helix transcriptional regulator [Chitinophagaceae bacterium]
MAVNHSNQILLTENNSTIVLDIIKNKKALYILRAINHPLRLSIIELLDKKHTLTVTEIYTQLNIQQAVISQNLAVLRRAGFVTTKKESKYVYYMLSYKYLSHFTKNVSQLLNTD